MGIQIGNLEETILLLVLIMGEQEVYGVSVAEGYKKQLNKSISIPAVHTVLKRLEEKGLVKSEFGEVSPLRGGKRKRIYSISKLGQRTLTEIKRGREELWKLVPSINISK